MAFNITDNSELDIYINDGWRDWYIPKFRLYWEIDEPTITLYWNDLEKGKSGILRKIVLDYTDVQFGYVSPSSASEVALVLQQYIVSAWTDIYNTLLNNYVPYTGATQNVDLGGYGLNTDFVAFSLNPFNSPAPGQIAYDGTSGSLSYYLDNSNVISNIGQTVHAYVHNDEGSPLTKGQVVYLFSASGNKASVKLARNLSDTTSAKTFGVCAENIATNQKGFVICQGRLDGLDTSMYSDGDTLYLGSTYGSTTNVKPYAPNHMVYVAIVEKSSNGNGIIYVRCQNGYELDEIHDVDLITTPPVNGDVLTYDGVSGLWKNLAPTGSSGITSLNSQTGATQNFATGSSGTDFNIASATNTHTFNIPTASATNRGLLSTSDWSTFNSKFTLPALTSGSVLFSNGTTIAQDNANLFWDDANNRLGIGTNTPANRLQVSGSITASSALGLCINFNPTLVASANNDILSCLDINPTFTNGAFTGLQNIGLRVFGSTAGVSPSLEVRQQSDTVPTWIAVRNRSNAGAVGAVSADLGISGGANQFFTGTVAGDVCFKAYSQTSTKKFFIGATAASAANLILHPNTNVGINTSTDAGFRLDVNGTTRFQGNITISTRDIITDTTTGSKIGTATTQKIGFWNATPIVQPTTAVAVATFAAVAGGSTIDTNDTFDGYTVGQVVKALRNLGILA